MDEGRGLCTIHALLTCAAQQGNKPEVWVAQIRREPPCLLSDITVPLWTGSFLPARLPGKGCLVQTSKGSSALGTLKARERPWSWLSTP